MKFVHYHVLEDSNKFTNDELKALSFQLCNTDLLSTRSVRIPAPAHYARLIAERCRNYLDEYFNMLVFFFV